MSALRLDDLISAAAAEQLGYSEAGARADDADHALLRERPLGTAQMGEMLVAELGDGVGDGAEIVDQGVALGAQPERDGGGADHPGLVGQLEQFALGRSGHGDPGGGGKRTAERGAERLPGGLQAGMLRRLEGAFLAEPNDPAALHFREGEAGVGAADVDRDDLRHAASPAEA